jgi:hypothetical protein
MLLHIRPRLFYSGGAVTLVDATIEAFGLRLRGGPDLAIGRPYPNKRYTVAYRKIGRKSLDGILIETTKPVKEWRCTARWAVEAQFLITHHVDYRISDEDFDAASDNMMLWYGCGEGLGGWSSRMPPEAEGISLMYFEPEDFKRATCQDKRDVYGRIVERHQTFTMPTIERERLLTTELANRMPSVEMAFQQNEPLTPSLSRALMFTTI